MKFEEMLGDSDKCSWESTARGEKSGMENQRDDDYSHHHLLMVTTTYLSVLILCDDIQL